MAIVPVFFDSLFKVRGGCCVCAAGSVPPARPGLLCCCVASSNRKTPLNRPLTLPTALPCLPARLPMLQVWIFIGLNKQDPAAAVTLKQMDRH